MNKNKETKNKVINKIANGLVLMPDDMDSVRQRIESGYDAGWADASDAALKKLESGVRMTTETLKNDKLEIDIELFEWLEVEMLKGQRKFGDFNSTHEFYAVLKEEVDELWETIKKNDMDLTEVLQVAAVAFRGLHQFSRKQDDNRN